MMRGGDDVPSKMPNERLRFLLVDGHSVIHSWEELRKLHLRAAKRYLAREELLKKMRLMQDVTGERVVVVFDGTGVQRGEERETAGLQIFYSDSGHTADSIIERLSAKYASVHSVRVCTADRMVWETVTALGGGWLSPEDLRYELGRAEGELKDRLKR